MVVTVNARAKTHPLNLSSYPMGCFHLESADAWRTTHSAAFTVPSDGYHQTSIAFQVQQVVALYRQIQHRSQGWPGRHHRTALQAASNPEISSRQIIIILNKLFLLSYVSCIMRQSNTP